MEGKLLVVLLLALAASGAFAIKCHVCTGLGAVCKDGEIGDLQTCPSVTGFVTNQCGKFDGKLTGSVAGTSISFEGVIRSCNTLPANIDAPPLRCFSGADATAYIRNLVDNLDPAAPSTGGFDVTITGDLCFCAGDGCNGVGSLKPFFWLILVVGLMHSLLM